MTDRIIYIDVSECEESTQVEERTWCLLRREFCKFIEVCPLGYIKR